MDSIYDDLPDDEELIFLKLERAFRTECEEDAFQAARNEQNGFVATDDYLRYMRRTAAVASELQLGIFDNFHIPPAEHFGLSDYRDFVGVVEEHRTAFQLRHARRSKGYSVRFDEKTRRIIDHHIGQIREIVRKLEVDEWKKDSLLGCLDAFQAEVDKNRSGYDVFGAFLVETAGVLGDAGEKLEPVRRIIDSIAGLIWGVKHAESTKSLPRPAPRKRIPAPKTKPKSDDVDDDISF